MPVRIMTVVGARPQFIKAAPLCRALAADRRFHSVLVHTGQHYDPEMSDVFFRELDLPEPQHRLGVGGGSHGAMTGAMIAGVERLCLDQPPDWMVVLGDTNSTLAGALAAAKLDIPVAHVEAGLRSFNRRMPEEINRVLVDHLSTLLLCPVASATANLAREGIVAGVHVVGDVMYDAVRHAAAAARASSRILDRLGLAPKGYAVATVHRQENTDSRQALEAVVGYLREAARDRPMVLPLHPRTRKALQTHRASVDGLIVTEPLGFLDMQRLVADAELVLTDSGGLQKEAYFHRVPCITLRDETEWGELVEAGWNRLWRGPAFAPRRPIDAFGDGRTADKIVALLAAAADRGPVTPPDPKEPAPDRSGTASSDRLRKDGAA